MHSLAGLTFVLEENYELWGLLFWMERDPLLIFWILDCRFRISDLVLLEDLLGNIVAEKEDGGSIIRVVILHRLFYNL